MAGLYEDLVAVLRGLRRSPLFGMAVAGILGVGIALSVAIFSVVHGVLLKPLPYPEPDRLVRIYNQMASRGDYFWTPVFYDEHWRQMPERFETLESFGRFYTSSEVLIGRLGPARVTVLSLDAGLLDLLGARVARGRPLSGDPSEVLLTDRAWRSHFGGAPDVVGSTIRLDEQTAVVAGVLTPEFGFFDGSPRLVRLYPENQLRWRPEILGRVRADSSREAARTELRAFYRNRDGGGDERPGLDYPVVSVFEEEVGDSRQALLALLGGALFVLLIASANAANLLLARSLRRGRELATRSALGAGRWRLTRMLAVEGVVLSLLGGLAGCVAALWLVRLLVAWAPSSLPRVSEVAIEAPVLVFAAGISAIAGVAASLAPVLTLSRRSQWGQLYSRGTGPRVRNRLVRSSLIVAEVALALILLAGCGLMARTFLALRGVELGFDSRDLLTWQVALPDSRYPDASRGWEFLDRLEEQLNALPGVERIAYSSGVPMGFSVSATWLEFPEGQEPPGFVPGQTIPGFGANPEAYTVNPLEVTPEYFEVLEVPLLTGRLLLPSDLEGAASPVVISRQMVEELWPDEDPVGRFLYRGSETTFEIVGVVQDVRFNDLKTRYLPTVYWPLSRDGTRGSVTVLARTSTTPEALVPQIRDLVARLDPELPLIGVTTVEAMVERRLTEPRYYAFLFTLFGLSALAMAAAGLYAVLSFAVGQRIPEIGVRMALGASASRVIRMVLRQAAVLIVIGTTLGLAGALLLTRFLQDQLFQVAPNDPATLVGAAAVLAAAALAACLRPGLRAGRVDPVQALRHD